MGTITVIVNDEIEKQFRETVKELEGLRKGNLGKAITEAMYKWVNEKRQKSIAQEMISLMEKGFNMGKIKIKSREELYDRWNLSYRFQHTCLINCWDAFIAATMIENKIFNIYTENTKDFSKIDGIKARNPFV